MTEFNPREYARLYRSLSDEDKKAYVATLTPEQAFALENLWEVKAREKQLPPEGDWRFWVLLAGRGFGKSISIVQWAHAQAMAHPKSRGVMVASTASDVRDVLVGGFSGILTVTPEAERPHHSPTYSRLEWKNGSSALLKSADEPERFRGPAYEWAICDEFASWRYPESFDQMLLGLREGENPRAAIATTPKPVKHLRDLIARPGCVVVGGSTYENRANLAPSWFSEIITKYEGTRLGDQELKGILLDDNFGALWKKEFIEEARVSDPALVPPLTRVLVSIDPAVTSNEESSETGITVGGVVRIAGAKHAYILADLTLKASPDEWARVAVNAYRDYEADAIVAEVNNGGDLVETIIHSVDPEANVIQVRASRGKVSRAEPVVAYYEQHRVHHVGTFALLEQQQVEWVQGQPSPDRIDSCVWLITGLMETEEEAVIMRRAVARYVHKTNW